jgi:hypothetical protein
MFKKIKDFMLKTQKPASFKISKDIKPIDDIEKSLWELKSRYDFDTEEISIVVDNYKNRARVKTK